MRWTLDNPRAIQGFPPLVVQHDETKIRAALKILRPKPEWRKDCCKDIQVALSLVQASELRLFEPRSKRESHALDQVLKALERAQIAKASLYWFDVRQFDATCNLEAGIAYCKRELDREKQSRGTPRPPSYRQQAAVRAAYYLVNTWLVHRRGLHAADALGKQSPWYRLSAILFGKDVNLLAHMSRYRKAVEQRTSDPARAG
jgi:hypothetical protein